jgi:hypothetical protein
MLKSLQPGQVLRPIVRRQASGTEIVSLDEVTPKNCD